MEALIKRIKPLEKSNYRAYQKLKGHYDCQDFTLFIDQVQPDPFAPASRLRAFRPWSLTGLEYLAQKSEPYQIAARDFIARVFNNFAKQEQAVQIHLSGQKVLDHSAVVFTTDGIEIRFRVDLPANGRDIFAKRAINLLTFHLPKFIRKATLARELDMDALAQHCQVVEDQVSLRQQLSQHNLVSFIADGSILPRISGRHDKPMLDAKPFHAPESLAVTLNCPHAGNIRGMGIKKGVSLIVGGGFHGKSTLLQAIQDSVYDHIAGDGREKCVTDRQAVKIRAEEGRCVHQLNIADFIHSLPGEQTTKQFSTQDASGSTSQAAWVQESVEAGASALLFDEDTSATNFMIRDDRMQALVCPADEPITPLVARVSQLYQQYGISTILVMGGSGDYFDVADAVIQMQNYQAEDVTEQARAIATQYPRSAIDPEYNLQQIAPRQLDIKFMAQLLAEGKFRMHSKDLDGLRFGKELINTQALEQLASSAQLNAVGWLWMHWVQHRPLQKHHLSELAETLDTDWLSRMPLYGDIARPRWVDVMAVVNRLRCADFHA